MTAEKKSQATALVELAHETFKFQRSTAGDVFALRRNGPRVVLPLRGHDSVRAALAAAYMEQSGRTPSATALTDALTVLEGRAYGTEPVELHLRVAPHPSFADAVVIDMGTADGLAITVTPEGWWPGTEHGVLFRRTALTSPMVTPSKAGSLEPLRDLLNVSAESWPLLVAWLVATFVPGIAHPILSLTGMQGTGKSSTAAKLVGLVDPSPAPLRTAPRDVESWAVTASGSWVVAVDNISTIQPWFSDALCRAVTGDGLVRRMLYSDSGVSVLSFKRNIILTTIDPGALRGDLAERWVPVELERIDATARRSDADLDAAYHRAAPGVLGALVTVVSDVLGVLPSVELRSMPRMADFARVCAAVDQVTGLDSLPRYLGVGGQLAAEVVEGDPVAVAVRDVATSRGAWTGTFAELLPLVRIDDAPKDYPSTPRALSGAVRRAAPALREVGIDVDISPRTARGVLVTITRQEAHDTVTTHTTVIATPSPAQTPVTVDPAPVTVAPATYTNRHNSSTDVHHEHAGGEGDDGRDGPAHLSSADVVDLDEYESRYADLIGEAP